MSIAAIVIAAAALYLSAVAVTYSQASAHYNRASRLYLEQRGDEGDAEMERGRKLKRRAGRMILHRERTA